MSQENTVEQKDSDPQEQKVEETKASDVIKNPLMHLTPTQVEHLTQTFKKLDTNDDGFVDENDIMDMLHATFPDAELSLLEEVRSVIFDTADRNHDGRIDLNEFLDSIASGQGVLPTEVEVVDLQVNSILSHLSPEEIDMFRDAFIRIDKNGDGFVDRDEMMDAVKHVVGGRYESLKTYLDKIYDVADKDEDGKLNLTEFLASFAEGPGVVPHEVVMESVQSIRVRLSDEEIAALQDSFICIDTNHDGFIDPDELKVALKDMLGKKYPDFTEVTFDEMVADALKSADKDQDGKLNLAEFIRSYQEDQGVLPSAFTESRIKRFQQRLTDEELDRLIASFNQLDLNGDGYIDEEEMAQILKGLLDQCLDNEEEAKDFIKLIISATDRNDDGKISLSEFVEAFASGSKAMDVPLMVAEQKIQNALEQLDEMVLEDDLNKLCLVFQVLDKNQDNYLEMDELQGVMTNLIKERYPEWEDAKIKEVIQVIISAADTNNDGKISLEEFIRSFYEGHEILPEEFVDEIVRAASGEGVAESEAEKIIEDSIDSVAQEQSTSPKQDIPIVEENVSASLPPKSINSANSSRVVAQTPGGSVHVRPPSPPDLPSPTRTRSTPLYFPNDVSGVAISNEQLWDLFERYDIDGNGYLNRGEFKKVYLTFEDYGMPLEHRVKEIDQLFSKFNTKGDEKLTFEEFALIMLHRSLM